MKTFMILVSLLWADSAGSAQSLVPRPDLKFTSNEVDVVYDQSCYAALEDLIGKAQKTIRMDFYLFGGRLGHHLADQLIKKYKNGVDVKIIFDRRLGAVPAMLKQIIPVYSKIRQAGVPITRSYHGIIDHNKYLVIDEEEALIGSTNVADNFILYHDLLMRVRGPVAVELARQFDCDWKKAHRRADTQAKSSGQGESVPDFSGAIPALNEPSLVRVIGTGYWHQISAYQSLVQLIDQAKTSIHVQMHYLESDVIIRKLIAARDRGVQVLILLDPGKIGEYIPVIHWAPLGIVNSYALIHLLKARMQVRLYQTSKQFTTAHMKLAVIDGNILYAGSVNWTSYGFFKVTETNLEVWGGRAPAQAEEIFQRDWSASGNARIPAALARFMGWCYRTIHFVRPH